MNHISREDKKCIKSIHICRIRRTENSNIDCTVQKTGDQVFEQVGSMHWEVSKFLVEIGKRIEGILESTLTTKSAETKGAISLAVHLTANNIQE